MTAGGGAPNVQSTPADTLAEPAWLTKDTPQLRRLLKRPATAVVAVAVVEFIYFSLASPYFLTSQVWGTILVIAAELGIIAVFGTLLLIAGQFDLSVGSVLGLTAAMIPYFLQHDISLGVTLGLVLVTCVMIGAFNAFLVVALGLPSLIVTIGGLMFYRGFALHLTAGENQEIGASTAQSLTVFNWTYHNVTVSAVWFAGFALLATILLGRTVFGNWIYATGGNRFSATTSGIRTGRVATALFIMSALAAGFSGLLYTSRLTSVDGLAGTSMELEVILAIVVGGTALHGGAGGVIGTIVGVFVLAMAKMGLILVGVPGYWYQAGIGLFLIVTVAMNETVRIRLERR